MYVCMYMYTAHKLIILISTIHDYSYAKALRQLIGQRPAFDRAKELHNDNNHNNTTTNDSNDTNTYNNTDNTTMNNHMLIATSLLLY